MRKLLLSLIILALLPSSASASVYLKTTGDDSTCVVDNSALACQTLAKAVSIVQDGQSVYCSNGTYTTTSLTRKFTRFTTIRGAGCHIPGLTITSGAKYNVMGLQIDGPLIVQGTDGFHANSNVAITNPSDRCFFYRGSTDVVLDGISIHDCRRGIAAPAGIADDSADVTIKNSNLQHFTEDGLAIGDTSNVNITDNTFNDMNDPANVLHNDGIQLFGNVLGINILRNTITNSRTQGMLLQAANGSNSNIFVQGNTVTGIGGVAVQVDAMQNTVVDSNKFCGGLALPSGLEALWFWSRNTPNDITVTNNQLSKQWSIRSQPVTVLQDFNNTVLTPCV